MSRNSRQGRIPSDLAWLIDDLTDVQKRVARLESPTGEAMANTVPRLADTVAELKELVLGLEERLDAYLETEAPAVIDARVATQIAALLAGDVTIGGNLVIIGTLTAPEVYDTDLSIDGPYRVVWVNEAGKIGHT